jgi:outer membrane protein OmpA-like peptidoglycan-associated protein
MGTWRGVVLSISLVGSLLRSPVADAQDLAEPSSTLPPNASFLAHDWIVGVKEWESGARDLAGGVKDLRAALKDLIPSIKGWELIEEDNEYLIRMESDLLFDFDSATLRLKAKADLTRFAEVIASYDRKELSITGHTDSKGSDTYNQDLSMRRAVAVERFLEGTGLLSEWRLTPLARGERQPIARNEKPDGSDDPDGRQKNRRVELRIKKSSP